MHVCEDAVTATVVPIIIGILAHDTASATGGSDSAMGRKQEHNVGGEVGDLQKSPLQHPFASTGMVLPWSRGGQ